MPSIDLNKASWFKSSHSGGDNNCVEAAHAPAVHAVRDSRHPDAGHLVFASAEWDAFITAVRLDHL
ncbi:DUF397 domain-containing protein [Actinorugispora endophytica]|uniref:Uncharacterized protein DUF397 n=1 Tax=Actinorugispora endophytica TaxID=1605990 RepID=A0A4R6UFJ5_9ACTN|nr:DUF397 domain-containing protein [Actinorugispora endophytica]TDQ45518.1 uncharacterized protein DUF397 [Actinorugispora endophytica]